MFSVSMHSKSEVLLWLSIVLGPSARAQASSRLLRPDPKIRTFTTMADVTSPRRPHRLEENAGQKQYIMTKLISRDSGVCWKLLVDWTWKSQRSQGLVRQHACY